MGKRRRRRKGRRFHWIAAGHVARLSYLLDEARFTDHDRYWRLYQAELRDMIKGRAALPPDHPCFIYPFVSPDEALSIAHPSTKG